jgi:hypothetical protein
MLFREQHNFAHLIVVQATVGLSAIARPRQQQVQDGGFILSQFATTALHSEPPARDQDRYKCDICHKEFKNARALQSVRDIQSREVPSPLTLNTLTISALSRAAYPQGSYDELPCTKL